MTVDREGSLNYFEAWSYFIVPDSVTSDGHQKELLLRISFTFVVISTLLDFHDKHHGIFKTGYCGKPLCSSLNQKHSINFGRITLLGMCYHTFSSLYNLHCAPHFSHNGLSLISRFIVHMWYL